jgi:RNA polymerase sigma-B factor
MPATLESIEGRARERLIQEHLPLVKAIARRHTYRGEPYDDLVQVGAIGLINAVDRFEPARGADFASFAVPNIVGEIRRYLRDASSPIRVPRRYQEISARLRSARRQLTAHLQRSPTSSELAAAAGLAESEIAEAQRAEHARAPLSLMDARPSLSTEEVFDAADDRVLVLSGMRSLHRRERQVLRFRYFDDLSQDEIAARLGISQTHTSRLLASGLAKLRAEVDGRTRCAAPRKAVHSWHGDSRRRRGSVSRTHSTQGATEKRDV